MSKTSKLLEIAEYSSFGSLVFGAITTAITKQVLYSVTPVAVTFFFSSLNNQRYKKKFTKQNQEIQNLFEEESKKNNDLLQDLIAFSDEYKYQKLELESLIKKAQVQTKQLKEKIDGDLNSSVLDSIVNRLNNLELSNSKIEQKIDSNIQVNERAYKNSVELNNENHNYMQQSSGLAGLTQYYPLNDLTQKLIHEAKISREFQHYRNTQSNTELSEGTLKYIQKIAKHSQCLAGTVIDYHNDHKCSKKEANILSLELNKLAIEISMIRSNWDLMVMYKAVTLFTYQISRFQHKKQKYRWNNSMREKMLNVFNDCLAKL